jgi:AbiV family abortive infection protein
MKLKQTIKICIQNGNRLLEDAKYLSDFGSYPSAYALARLAQEEFAKSFIMKLVQAKALKWTKEVRKSLNHHISKQLIGIILEYLNPDTDDFLKMINDNSLFKRPKKVSDAMNIYIHEILRRWESQNWVWVEDPEYDKEAKSVYRGKDDKLKQDAIYIKISKDGQAINSPVRFRQADSGKEIEKAERYGQLVNAGKEDLRYKEIVEIFKIVK